MKLAALQMTSGPEVTANLEQARLLLEEAAARGARLAALPENFSFMGLKDADKRAVAEDDGSGAAQDFLGTSARRLGLWIVGGTIPLKAGSDGRVAAASLVYDSDGRRVARYDKIHLFDVDIPGRGESYRESAHVAPGAAATVLDTPLGRLGLSVCYDVRFPELYRHLSAAGAQLLAVPSAFTSPTGRAHWETLLRARAIENLCYVVAPAQSGFHPSGRETYGDSMIVDFWGRVLERVPRGRGCAVAEVDLERQAGVRESFPALIHRTFAPQSGAGSFT
ncbi:MAG TPA: carbon-nitrogen hydrolase family protein [Steroidobacteraceae bacterium]|jgi:predicted amidohydrolase|nr:carbon-nitrogen hydrolase family protein [Steroidobacteraceae bacterium]